MPCVEKCLPLDAIFVRFIVELLQIAQEPLDACILKDAANDFDPAGKGSQRRQMIISGLSSCIPGTCKGEQRTNQFGTVF